jgi:hypothetical protein
MIQDAAHPIPRFATHARFASAHAGHLGDEIAYLGHATAPRARDAT